SRRDPARRRRRTERRARGSRRRRAASSAPPYLRGSVPQVEMEARRRRAQLPQRPRLELANALARNPELPADLFERLRDRPVQTEAPLDDEPHPRLQSRQGLVELR